MSTPYDDIINHPHHVSRNHPPMPMYDRAAQFSPFAALVGHEDAIGETARLTEQRIEPDEQAAAELNRRLSLLKSRLAELPEVTIGYFVPDCRKRGGAYATVSGKVVKISPSERTITLSGGETIAIADVTAVNGEMFADFY